MQERWSRAEGPFRLHLSTTVDRAEQFGRELGSAGFDLATAMLGYLSQGITVDHSTSWRRTAE
jgi:hypothetical protein